MRVLISGCSIAGPSAAYFLAKSGHTVTVIEKQPSILPIGASVDLKGSAVKVVKMMGVLDAIRQHTTTETGMQFVDTNGKAFGTFLVADGISATQEIECLRGDLADILASATKDHPAVTYRFSTTIKNVLQNDDTGVKVELSDDRYDSFLLLYRSRC